MRFSRYVTMIHTQQFDYSKMISCRTIISGKAKSGKTELCKMIIQQNIQNTNKRIYIIPHTKEDFDKYIGLAERKHYLHTVLSPIDILLHGLESTLTNSNSQLFIFKPQGECLTNAEILMLLDKVCTHSLTQKSKGLNKSIIIMDNSLRPLLEIPELCSVFLTIYKQIWKTNIELVCTITGVDQFNDFPSMNFFCAHSDNHIMLKQKKRAIALLVQLYGNISNEIHTLAGDIPAGVGLLHTGESAFSWWNGTLDAITPDHKTLFSLPV